MCRRYLRILQIFLFIIYNNKILALNNDAKNDCFEHIVVDAMLPFETTFRNEDINSLKVCQEICVKEGERCQTIAFGVHIRGNGTCQLSSQKIDGSMLRPHGTIFDPDFDIYARKLNCFTVVPDINTIPTAGFPNEGTINSNRPPPSSPPLPPSSSFDSVNTDDDSLSVTSRLPPSTPSTMSDSTHFTPPQKSDRYPTTYDEDRNRFNEFNRRPSYGTTYDMRKPTTMYPTYNQNRDRLDFYPLYKYPMLYEQDFPSTSNHASYPGTYAQNVPTVDDRYRPNLADSSSNRLTTPRPVYGLGYGHDYTYGIPTNFESTPRPTYNVNYGGTVSDGRSEYPSTTPTTYNGDRVGTTRTPYRPNYNTDSNNYMPKPNYQTQEKYGPGANVIPLNDGANDQSKPSTEPGRGHENNQEYGPTTPPYGTGTGIGTGMGTGIGTATGAGGSVGLKQPSHPQHYPSEGNYHRIPGQSIETYFNPEDYLQTRWTIKPGIYGGFSSGYGGRYPVDDIFRACFRRVLAGKRVAPHWVRRTLACERVEDCMQECGHEKRFTCEGFNYRLDPSGHGQGDCELIEIPLSQMDLYSSTHNRDSNLLRHPDYDYYERDRNAPSSCRQTSCIDCGVKPLSPPPSYYRPYDDHYSPPSSSGYGTGPATDRFKPPDTAIDKYHPIIHPHVYESRPPSSEYHYDFSSHSYDGGFYKPSSYGSDIDRYDIVHSDDVYKPNRWEIQIPSSHGTSYGIRDDYYDRPDHYRPPYRPGPDYSPYRPHREHDHHRSPYPVPPPPPASSLHVYYDRDRPDHKKPSRFIPYLIGTDEWATYGGSYGGSSYSKDSDYWGIRNENRRKDRPDFNYFELGGRHKYEYGEDNYVWNYPGSRYGFETRHPHRDRPDYSSQWTRRPGLDECSVKSGEGFRLHKGVIRHSYVAPSVTECEKLCYSEDKFICHTYSYRYSTLGRENCLLCDRPVNLLDYYVDIEPDRDYDIYSMADDFKSCKYPSSSNTAISHSRNNAQCFFRAIDATRFFKSIVRDSLTVRSVGECELECIKITKFTCRAFAFRYGQRSSGGIIDNCQLSDWPVRDMDKERHLILDPSFDVFERASYGHGCEIQPIVDEKHKKLCYLGYGSPAKLLTTAIKKVISVPTELECKNECIRHRETTSFKCLSFSFGSQVSTFNCEMSDLDQTQLKLNIHYAHTPDRDYWLFAWNPFDWTCRDMVATIGGNRVNNDRRMDIFREPGEVTWRHFTVSGKQCRIGNGCDKNLITGFYSCEIEGGEIGAWDYCCKADHPCGYSQGFDYPWCFVGDEYDQWRKCSDRYYPNSPGPHHYHHHNIQHNDSSSNNNTQTSRGIIYSTKKTKKKNEQYQTLPRPDGLENLNDFTAARLWPVTYLYSEGPPNSTELSNFVDCNKDAC